VFSKTGTAEMASDPMPPNATDTFIMLKPEKKWPNPHLTKDKLIERIEEQVSQLPGNKYEFTQPIEMRFNELIAGTRGDLAIKVYGDDYKVLEKMGGQIGQVLESIAGSEEVQLTQADGQPTLEIELIKNGISRLGLRGSDVFGVISTAIGGTQVGEIFEGDK